MADAPLVHIYTDGACSRNPGPGGWAAIAALEALRRPARVELHTDSEYVRNGISQWLAGWKRNGWRTAAREPVKNHDLWQRLDNAQAGHQVRWHWVRGHAGHTENERADALARAAMRPFLSRRGDDPGGP